MDWVEAHAEGIYIRPADIWIDPSSPKADVIVTHGHADHARGGHGRIYATPETLEIVKLRYGVSNPAPLSAGDGASLGGVQISLHPAGHVLGSAQVLLEYAGERVVVTGDYKRRRDPTCAPFELVPCNIFITEATFGLPVFKHPPVEEEIAKLLDRVRLEQDRCVLVGAYALGKAQRIIAELRRAGWNEPIYIHGALEKMCELYSRLSIELGELRLVTDIPKDEMKGQIVVCPPSALHDRWSRRLPDPITAMASGWMRVRGRARQRNVELPLIISDHADWDELTQTISELRPSETWVTHGSEAGLVRWCELNQLAARALSIAPNEPEDAD